MGTLDDLPTRHKTHDIGHAAEVAFEAAIDEQKLFAVQSRDRSDYGTDVQIEVPPRGCYRLARHQLYSRRRQE